MYNESYPSFDEQHFRKTRSQVGVVYSYRDQTMHGVVHNESLDILIMHKHTWLI